MIFFDIDNTLVNHSEAAHKAAIRFGHEYCDKIPNYNKAFPKTWEIVGEKYIKSFLEKKITFQEQRRRSIRAISHQDYSNADADCLSNDYL